MPSAERQRPSASRSQVTFTFTHPGLSLGQRLARRERSGIKLTRKEESEGRIYPVFKRLFLLPYSSRSELMRFQCGARHVMQENVPFSLRLERDVVM